MIAVKLQGTVTADHHLDLIIPSSVPLGEVESILFHPERRAKPKKRVRQPDPYVHPAAGIWADRQDIDHLVTFVTDLRRRLERCSVRSIRGRPRLDNLTAPVIIP
jgi:hypothetical protein